jgi:tetratricopeptide (TPR) repeat protein
MKLLLLFFRYNEAEEQLNICLQIYKLCLPPNSFHYLVTKASLGLVYKQKGNYAQALTLFQNISRSLGINIFFPIN